MRAQNCSTIKTVKKRGSFARHLRKSIFDPYGEHLIPNETDWHCR